MISIPLRGENETVEDWYPRFRKYEEEKLKAKERSLEEHLKRVNVIYRLHQDLMDRYNAESNEIRAIISDIDQIIKEVKERKEDVQI